MDIPVETYVGTDSKAVIDEPVRVYWISVGTDKDERGDLHIRDGFSTSDEKRWSHGAFNGGHFVFNPPIRCAHGLYVEVDTSAINVYTVGYIRERNLPGS